VNCSRPMTAQSWRSPYRPTRKLISHSNKCFVEHPFNSIQQLVIARSTTSQTSLITEKLIQNTC